MCIAPTKNYITLSSTPYTNTGLYLYFRSNVLNPLRPLPLTHTICNDAKAVNITLYLLDTLHLSQRPLISSQGML